MASQVYFNGDFFEAAETASPGQSPTTHPAKWRRVPIPRDAATYLVAESYALIQTSDGQDDKARAAHRRSQEMLDRAIVAMRRFNSSPDTMTVLSR
jgi:hypothetical protein